MGKAVTLGFIEGSAGMTMRWYRQAITGEQNTEWFHLNPEMEDKLILFDSIMYRVIGSINFLLYIESFSYRNEYFSSHMNHCDHLLPWTGQQIAFYLISTLSYKNILLLSICMMHLCSNSLFTYSYIFLPTISIPIPIFSLAHTSPVLFPSLQ